MMIRSNADLVALFETSPSKPKPTESAKKQPLVQKVKREKKVDDFRTIARRVKEARAASAHCSKLLREAEAYVHQVKKLGLNDLAAREEQIRKAMGALTIAKRSARKVVQI